LTAREPLLNQGWQQDCPGSRWAQVLAKVLH